MEPKVFESAAWAPALQQKCEPGHLIPILLSHPKAMTNRARRAQAMVEFALALPIFLLLVYGIMEVSRVVFMYASVATASREGARYASAWGVNSAGTKQYQDCAGIRSAAKNTGFLLGLTASSIQIFYDTGPSALTPTPYCPSTSSVDTTVTLGSCNRVIVTVSATYKPILPLFLPLTTQTMSSTTRRTVMGVMDLNNPTSCP